MGNILLATLGARSHWEYWGQDPFGNVGWDPVGNIRGRQEDSSARHRDTRDLLFPAMLLSYPSEHSVGNEGMLMKMSHPKSCCPTPEPPAPTPSPRSLLGRQWFQRGHFCSWQDPEPDLGFKSHNSPKKPTLGICHGLHTPKYFHFPPPSSTFLLPKWVTNPTFHLKYWS